MADDASNGSPAADTLPKLLAHNAARIGARPACRLKEFGIWQTWTWRDVHREVRDLAMGLLSLNLRAGDRVAIAGRNTPRMYWSMVAVQMAGGVPVPVYADAVVDELQFVFENAEITVAIVQDQEQVDKMLSMRPALPRLGAVIYAEPRGLRNYDQPDLYDFEEVQQRGRDQSSALAPKIDAITAALTSDDVCVMLYTSGTTGRPKGVILTQNAIVSTAAAAASFDGLTERDEVLAYLPLAWVGDFIFSIGQSYVSGFCVACPESDATVAHDLREIGPSYYFAPPRVFEALLTSVSIRIEDAGAVKRRLYHHFMAHAARVGAKILDKQSVGLFDRLWYRLGEAMIYGPLKNAIGLSKVRVGYTAGEAIGPEIFAFYRSIGINLKQLYGQTEASVFITQQPDGGVRDDTVGVPSPGVELKISDNGEVMYRSPGVFREYHQNEKATAETKTDDGWVFTGDAGFIEPDTGHLRIIDRAKDVGKLASGALFAPKYIENKLKFFSNIQEAVAFGAGRDHVTAFINIDLSAVGNWAERNNVAYASYQELANHPDVYAMIGENVAEVNRSLAADPLMAGCQIRRFLVLHKELDADDGELTRTRKVRRRLVADRYEALVTALYSDAETVFAETEVTYEDGRKGVVSGVLRVADAKTFPAATPSPTDVAA